MFFHRPQLRRWAARGLALWVFGVVTGVANACLLSDTSHPEATAAALGASHDRHGDEGGAGKANCLDFCEKSSAATPAAKTALDLFHIGAPPVLTLAMLPAAEPRGAMWHAVLPDRQGAPPIRIAFLRMAL